MYLSFQKHIRPQPSERWAMYRLICPVVDAACEKNGLEPFFEYSQPNGPNRRLSADIALKKESSTEPTWLIEAKKFNRAIYPEMIAPYLRLGGMGVVTNGNYWIIVVAGNHLDIGPLIGPDQCIDQSIYNKLVSIISKLEESEVIGLSDAWTPTWQPSLRISGPPIWRAGSTGGTRIYHKEAIYEGLQEAVGAARLHAKDGTMAAILLDEIKHSGRQASDGYFKVNQDRMTWWHKAKRLVRLSLTGQQMEMLAHNDLLDHNFNLKFRGSIKMHDKNPCMSILKVNTHEELAGLAELFNKSIRM